ncbi:hypothetical protein KC842_00965 [Candidatus Nomurabacteria bacterium]|nr:hypothetical protein [Candidatus Nomurabacteria bacterium]
MLKVAVLRGGPNENYDISIASGESIISALKTHSDIEAQDLFFTKDMNLLWKGRPLRIEDLHKHFDLVWNNLHGFYGEDGKIQTLFENFGVKHTGPGACASASAFHKRIAKDVAKNHSVKTPEYVLIDFSPYFIDQDEEEIVAKETDKVFRKIAPPWIVKPLSDSFSRGVVLARTLPELAISIARSYESGEDIMVEEYIEGSEFSVGVIDGYRGENYYILPPVKRTSSGKHLSHEDVCSGISCHSFKTIDENSRSELMRVARVVHDALGMKDYSSSDFIVHPKKGVYYLETDALPDLRESSPFRVGLDSVGGTIEDFVKHIVSRKR